MNIHFGQPLVRKLSIDVRERVIKLWLEGCTYNVIELRASISQGSIANTIEEERKKILDIDDLCQLNFTLKKDLRLTI